MVFPAGKNGTDKQTLPGPGAHRRHDQKHQQKQTQFPLPPFLCLPFQPQTIQLFPRRRRRDAPTRALFIFYIFAVHLCPFIASSASRVARCTGSPRSDISLSVISSAIFSPLSKSS